MKTFAKIIGASCGMVALLFVLVAAALHWTGDDPATPAPLAHQAPKPPPKPLPPPQTAAKLPTKKPEPPPQQTPAPPAALPAASTPAAAPKKEPPKMSTDEYVARQMHYIGKIQKDTQAVLTRATEQRQKTAQIEAELDGLLYQ